jgi:hypothetical protein
VAWGNSWLGLQPSLLVDRASSTVCWTHLCNTGGLCRQAGVSRMAGQLSVQTLSGVVQLQQSRGCNAEDRRVHVPLRLSGRFSGGNQNGGEDSRHR